MENFFETPQFLCLENLVGISRKTCDCLAEVRSEKEQLVRLSNTGLFIDEHDGAVGCLFLEKAKCFEGDVWDKLIIARKESILQIMVDISVTLDNRFATIKPYSHHFGELGYSSLLNLPTGPQAVSFKTSNLSGAKMRLNAFGLITKLLGGLDMHTIRITIKNKTKNVVISEFDFDVKMRVRTFGFEADATMYDMPVIELLCDGSEYEISYDLNTTKMLVYDNQLVCKCEGVRTSLRKYFEVLPLGLAKGMLFNVQYVCDDNYLLCALANSNATIRFLVAEAIRCLTLCKFLTNMKARASFGASIENILSLNEIDALINAFNQKYNQTLSDIQVKANSLPNFGCFTCNTMNHAKREGIFVSDSLLQAQIELSEINAMYQRINNSPFV